MKNRKVFFAALCIAALGLGSCFSSWNGGTGEGTISINLGNNRALTSTITDEMKAAMVYTITLTGIAEEIVEGPYTGGSVIIIAVSPGNWNIIVTAYLNEQDYEGENPYAEGRSEKPVTVRAGENSPVSIRMELIGDSDSSGDINVEIDWGTIPENVSYTVTITNTDGDYEPQTREDIPFDEPVYFKVEPGEWTVEVEAFIGEVLRAYGETEVKVEAGKSVTASVVMNEVTKVVRTWDDLKDIFEKNSGENEIVIITGDLDANSTMNIEGVKWNITLLAEKDVAITKSGDIQNSLFRVLDGCSLTLGGTGQGTITINGGGYGRSSLILVQAGGELIMHDGVTLTDNHATQTDRGGGVTVNGGSFTMNGGVISGNTTVTYGGGVRILSGSFIKTGGTIYGFDDNDQPDNSSWNKVVDADGSPQSERGHAIYAVSSVDDIIKFKDTTSGRSNDIYFVPDEGDFSSWENNPDIPDVPDAVIDLDSSTWHDDLLSVGEAHYYRFHAEPEQSYYVRWNDSWEGDGTKTVDIEVTAKWEGADDTIFQEVDSAYENPWHIPPSASGGYVILMLEGYYYSSFGTYAIGYYPEEGPNLPLVVPDAVIEIESSQWYNNSLSVGGMHYYRFYAEPEQSYYVSWNDSYEGNRTKTVDIKVAARWETTGYPVFQGADSGYESPWHIPPSTSGGNVILMVEGCFSSSSGTYAIRYYPDENNP